MVPVVQSFVLSIIVFLFVLFISFLLRFSLCGSSNIFRFTEIFRIPSCPLDAHSFYIAIIYGRLVEYNWNLISMWSSSYTAIINSMLRNINISNDNGSFTFYVYVFFPLSLPRLLPELTLYMSNTTGVLFEAGTAYLPFEFIPGFLVKFLLLIFLIFCVVLLCVFTFWVPYCDFRYEFRLKRCSIRLLKQRPTHPKHMTSYPFLFVFVLFHHNLYMHCFIDYCLSCILSVYLQFRIPTLLSSTFS